MEGPESYMEDDTRVLHSFGITCEEANANYEESRRRKKQAELDEMRGRLGDKEHIKSPCPECAATHDQAMDVAELGFWARANNGHQADALEFFRKALELELKVIKCAAWAKMDALTKFVLLQSAAALAAHQIEDTSGDKPI